MSKDIVGERGEIVFRAAITNWCGKAPRFEVVFQGEKAEALDFQVKLRSSTVFQAVFFVQVKATAKKTRYSGVGKDRKLLVTLKKADASKLGRMKIPAYVVGVDAWSEAAFIKHIPAGTTSGFKAMPTRQRLNCRNLGRLWHEVEAFWNTRPQGLTSSVF